MSTINSIINDPAYHDLLAILKGARNGVVYGAKIRFPHALVISMLFGRGDWLSRLRNILRHTKQHAMNLGMFVTIYKSLLLLQRRLNGGHRRSSDTFFAGLMGGYIVFGNRSAINEQIVLYVCSRVIISFLARDRKGAKPAPSGGLACPLEIDPRQYSIFAALVWGAVMWLFENRSETIQPGMWNSMKYLYKDSEHWDSLRTLLWQNK